jgi:serine/threonine-protein kinase
VSETTSRSICGYAIERELGSGGMGVVLLGRQTSLDRPAVLKRLRRELAALPEVVERFQREARAAAALHHPNVVTVYDSFAWRNEPYIALEYVDGLDLRDVLKRVGRVPPRIAGLVALEVARGLEAIHARGTVHRDLKPANILLSRAGEVKIADFGIALEPTEPALTRTGVVLGTPPYMAPEQLMGERLDPRGDLFSLGVVLYEMLTGERPFDGGEQTQDDPDALLTRMRRERYASVRQRAPAAPRYLEQLVRRLLRARPRQRLASAAALRRELEARLRPPSRVELQAELSGWLWDCGAVQLREGETLVQLRLPAPPERRRTGLLAAAVTAALVAGALMADLLWVRSETPRTRPVPAPADAHPGVGPAATPALP